MTDKLNNRNSSFYNKVTSKVPDIFISYSNEDYELLIHDINRFVEEDEYSLFLRDYVIDYPQSQIENMIIKSSLLIVYISHNAIESDIVREDIRRANDYKTPILPIFLEESELKRGIKLDLMSFKPINKYNLSNENYINTLNDYLKKYGIKKNKKISRIIKFIFVGEGKKGTGLRCIQPSIKFKSNSEIPFIYICNNHSDDKEVFDDLNRLKHEQDVNIWFDDEIHKNLDWAEIISEKIDSCSLFLVFISKSSVESQNIRNQINFALFEEKPILMVYLEDTKLKYGLDLTLPNIKSIHKYKYTEKEYLNQLKRLIQEYKL